MPPSCSGAAAGSRPLPSFRDAPRRRASAWAMPGPSSRATGAPPRARKRRSARRASPLLKPPTTSSDCSNDGDACVPHQGATRAEDARPRAAGGSFGLARLHANLLLPPGCPPDRASVSFLLPDRPSLSFLWRNAFVRVHVGGRRLSAGNLTIPCGEKGAEAGVEGPGAASSRIHGCAPPGATLSLAPPVDAANLRRISGVGTLAMGRGLFITFEGTEGSGKTTQV